MAYTTILSEQKSTYGSPYCFYTVQYENVSRSETSVTLKIKISSHLQYSSSYNGYALTGVLTVGNYTHRIPLKTAQVTWSGTTVYDVTDTISVSAGASTSALPVYFAVTTTGATSSALSQVSCSNIAIPLYYTKANISAVSAKIGETVSISLTGKYPSDAYCNIAYSFEGLTGNVTSNNKSTSFSWDTSELVTEMLSKIPNSGSGTCTLTCDTYYNGAYAGRNSCNITLKTDEKISIDSDKTEIEPVSENSFLKDKAVFVAGYSKAKVTVAATAGNGASVNSYEISGLGTVGASASWTSGVLSEAGEKHVLIKATDTRGTSASISKDIEILSYSNPAIALSAVRGTRTGDHWEDNIDGEHIKVTIAPTFSIIDDSTCKNTATVELSFDNKIVLSEKIENTNEIIHFINNDENKGTSTSADILHMVKATILDSLGNESSAATEIPTAVVNMSMHPKNEGVTFGGHPHKTGLVSEFAATFNNEVYINWEKAGFSSSCMNSFVNDEEKCIGLRNLLLEFVYPIGSYYWSSQDTSPDELFGGTWEKIEGKFVLAQGGAYGVGETGGAATVTLTKANLPSHTHSLSATAASSGSHNHSIGCDYDGAGGGIYATIHKSTATSPGYWSGTTASAGAHTHTISGTAAAVGDGTAHNNMPPYIVSYCWRRKS